MRILLSIILFASFGCVDASKTVTNKPVNPIDKIVQPANIEQAALQFFLDYAAAAALVADETASKCAANQFKDVTEADVFFSEQTKTARLKVNEVFAIEMTKYLADEKGKKASSVESVYRGVARGFRSIKK